jgi:uncharacterized protein (TIGR00369 family)
MTSKLNLSEPPQFLSILGSKGFELSEDNESITMNFDVGEELTHSNGTIVQGGFITAMLDTSMAHLIIFKMNGEYNPLTLSINVTFLAPGSPGQFTAYAKVDKLGKSISFTSANLHQHGKLIATATATNKLVKF